MYGNTDMAVAEPAFCVYVDAAGQTEFRIGYAGADDRGDHTVDALRIHSGDIEREPYIQYFGSRGKRHCSPTYVVRGERFGRWADFVADVLRAARELSGRYGVEEEDPVELMDDVAAGLQLEQETRGAASSELEEMVAVGSNDESPSEPVHLRSGMFAACRPKLRRRAIATGGRWPSWWPCLSF